MNKRTGVATTLIVAGVAGAYWWMNTPTGSKATSQSLEPGSAIVAVTVPALDGNAAIGAQIFTAKCAACHGQNAAGAYGSGPPLVHKIYEPGHHGDGAFLVAVQNGVRAHHWPFGDMPPQEGLTRGDVIAVVAYVRALQVANGIN